MSSIYLPLHHKYRPKIFDDLVGQDAIVCTLKQALITNKIAPAYLFCGPRGTGKTSSARILARSLNCLNSQYPTIDPCNECELCKEIGKGTALDVIEIDAASNTGVDNIRELIEKAQFAPVQARWKVYVIDECHMLSTAAFNALLKTLEEPPSRTVFVLATTDPQRLLPTIISRCQRFDFRRISLNSLIEHLQMIATKETINIDKDSIKLIAQRSEGGLRDAESLLDQLSLLEPPIKLESVWELIGEVAEPELIKMTCAVASKEPSVLIKTCRDLIDNGKEPIQILQGFTSTLRDLVIIKSIPNSSTLCSLSKEGYNTLKDMSVKIKLETILNWQSYLKGCESQIRQSFHPHLWLEVILLGILSDSTNNQSNINTKIINIPLDIEKKVDSKAISSPTNKNSFRESDVNTRTSNPKDKDKDNLNLEKIWQEILSKIELPSTKMLLSQQANLTYFNNKKIKLSVSENWIGMIQSRKSIIEKAIEECLGNDIELFLEKQSNIKNNPKQVLIENNIKGPASVNISKENAKDLEEDKVDFTNQTQQSKTKTIVNGNTENFANFFNGKVIDLESEHE